MPIAIAGLYWVRTVRDRFMSVRWSFWGQAAATWPMALGFVLAIAFGLSGTWAATLIWASVSLAGLVGNLAMYQISQEEDELSRQHLEALWRESDRRLELSDNTLDNIRQFDGR